VSFEALAAGDAMKRFVLAAALLVLVAGAAALWFLIGSLDRRVQALLERVGSEMTLAPVQVSGVSLDLAAGRGTIRDITIGNPDGFPDGRAVSLRELSLSLELGSLRTGPVVLPEIVVGEPRIDAILLADGRMNLDALRRNLESFADRRRAASSREPDGRGATRGEDLASELRLRVHELRISEGRIGLDASALGRDPEELALGSFVLRELGGARGATPEQLGPRILGALVARAARAVAGAEVKRALREKGGEIGEKLGEWLQRGLDR
jgi:uncharacterized protein involved in outer membrane biogenesis